MGLSPLLNSIELNAGNNAGTGAVTLGTVLTANALTMAEAGGVDGQSYVWRLDAVNGDFEIVRGVYTASGPSFSRDTVIVSKIGGVAGTSKISVLTTTSVRLVAVADDLITRQQSLSRGWLIGG